MVQWISDHRVLLSWLTGASVVLFVATLVIVPMVVVRIPPDYYTHAKRPPSRWARLHPAVRMTLHAAKNVLGYMFIGAGLAMLVLPGQGLLTLLIGFLMVDYPGKYRVEKWLISRRRIRQPVNWFRARRGRAPLGAAVGPPDGER